MRNAGQWQSSSCKCWVMTTTQGRWAQSLQRHPRALQKFSTKRLCANSTRRPSRPRNENAASSAWDKLPATLVANPVISVARESIYSSGARSMRPNNSRWFAESVGLRLAVASRMVYRRPIPITDTVDCGRTATPISRKRLETGRRNQAGTTNQRCWKK